MKEMSIKRVIVSKIWRAFKSKKKHTEIAIMNEPKILIIRLASKKVSKEILPINKLIIKKFDGGTIIMIEHTSKDKNIIAKNFFIK